MKKLMTFAMFIALLNMVSCAKKAEDSDSSSSSSKHQVSLQFGEYTTAKYSPMDILFPKAHAAVSALNFCVKRLRFKTAETVEEAGDNIDFDLGEIEVASSGTVLGSISVPEGEYRRIEIDLDPVCGDAQDWSVLLTNDHGTFQSGDRVTIRFEGSYIVNSNEAFNLDIQPILDAANMNNNSDTLGDELEDAIGE